MLIWVSFEETHRLVKGFLLIISLGNWAKIWSSMGSCFLTVQWLDPEWEGEQPLKPWPFFLALCPMDTVGNNTGRRVRQPWLSSGPAPSFLCATGQVAFPFWSSSIEQGYRASSFHTEHGNLGDDECASWLLSS